MMPELKPRTNADRFRSATDEALARFLSRTVPVVECPREVWDMITREKMRYETAWLHWLQMTAEDLKCPTPST